jgi:hypothetical protein
VQLRVAVHGAISALAEFLINGQAYDPQHEATAASVFVELSKHGNVHLDFIRV